MHSQWELFSMTAAQGEVLSKKMLLFVRHVTVTHNNLCASAGAVSDFTLFIFHEWVIRFMNNQNIVML